MLTPEHQRGSGSLAPMLAVKLFDGNLLTLTEGVIFPSEHILVLPLFPLLEVPHRNSYELTKIRNGHMAYFFDDYLKFGEKKKKNAVMSSELKFNFREACVSNKESIPQGYVISVMIPTFGSGCGLWDG